MKRGFTLVEVLVAATLSLLLLALLLAYLLPVAKASYRHHTRSHLVQTATLALNKILLSSGSTSPGGFSWSTAAPVALAFNPVDELQASNGVLAWSPRYEVFWWDQEEGILRYRVWPSGSPSATADEVSAIRAKRLSPQRLLEISSSHDMSKELARGVQSFEVHQKGPSEEILVQPVTVTLELKEPGSSSQDSRDRVKQSMTFRLVNQQ